MYKETGDFFKRLRRDNKEIQDIKAKASRNKRQRFNAHVKSQLVYAGREIKLHVFVHHSKKARIFIYSSVVAISAIIAAIIIPLSMRKNDFVQPTTFGIDKRAEDASIANNEPLAISKFDLDNSIIMGEAIKEDTKSIVNWSDDIKLVNISKNDVLGALLDKPSVFTYYFAKVETLKPSTQAFSLPTVDRKIVLGPNEIQASLNADVNDPKYRGRIPTDYDTLHKGVKDAKLTNGIANFRQSSQDYAYAIIYDNETCKILSIKDSKGNELGADKLNSLKPIMSEVKVKEITPDARINSRFISYSEAIQNMDIVIDELIGARGVRIQKNDFLSMRSTGSNSLNIYKRALPGIGLSTFIDVPQYIKLVTSKTTDNDLTFNLSFDHNAFPKLNESISFNHEIALYSQNLEPVIVVDGIYGRYHEITNTDNSVNVIQEQ